MTATTFITPAKAKQMASFLEAFDYQLEIDNGAIECPKIDASSLHTRLEKHANGQGEYFSNIAEDFCLANGLDVRVVANSFP